MDKRQKERYFCSTFLKEIGEEGQEKLLNSKVFIVGAGGLGNQILLHLATSGVGHIGLSDPDIVKLDNLPRQILYSENDLGKYKVDVALEKIRAKNSDVDLKIFKEYIDENNARKLFKGFDLVIDATDNFKSKFLIEDICKELGVPFITAGVSDFKGQIMLVTKNSEYTFKSLFDELPINIEQKYIDEDKGVYPLAVSLVSDLTSNEAIKYLLGIGEPLIDILLTIDTLKVEIKKHHLK